ncbi:NADPH-dependent FMN reductase [Nocardiopsis oceani]
MPTTETPTLAVVIGSIRPDRFGPTVARWFTAEARRHGAFDIDLIDLADYELPVELAGNDYSVTPPEDVVRLGSRLAKADAFTLITPVYNRSYPASLKTAIDWFYSEWVLRPVSFISYGGITGGLTAVEHLRGIFPEFPAIATKSFISLANFEKTFDYDGRPVDSAGLRTPATAVLDELAWWAPMLREARKTRPYPGLDFELPASGESHASSESHASATTHKVLG